MIIIPIPVPEDWFPDFDFDMEFSPMSLVRLITSWATCGWIIFWYTRINFPSISDRQTIVMAMIFGSLLGALFWMLWEEISYWRENSI